ncbi:thiamine transporter 2-like isoform X2 [Myzus persicae]|uniref:thiamine transporter 2-like isoform X2 n=1 Tax=Myzus persicae TaxID=13164 RepID=UPI000B936A47|nr:thiamine transporter 2-like isoform X2 [Myzus persicae]
MRSWTTIIALAVIFAFAIEFRPLDHFMTSYFIDQGVNTTDTQMAELCVAFFKSYEVVYFSYLFARVQDKRYYQATSGLARAAMLMGKCCSLVFAQTLVVINGKGYVKELPCYTLGSVVFAFVWASFMPSVRRKSYNKDDTIAEFMLHNNNEPLNLKSRPLQSQSSAAEPMLRRMRRDFNESYKNLIVLKWSIWYCLALVGYMTIKITCVTHKLGENEQADGVVESLTVFIGAIGSYKIGVKRVNWELNGNAFIGSGSLILGVCVLSCYFHQHMLSIQLSYILFGALIQAMFVTALSEVAKQLKNNCYALVLGFNSFISLVLLLCYKEIFIRGNLFKIDIPEQVLFYGGLYILLGIVYLIPSAISFNRKLNNSCPVYDVTE